MTTLQTIGFTLAGGSIIFGLTLFAFGRAVANQSVFVAPRCIARPPSVIYNKHHAKNPQAQKDRSSPQDHHRGGNSTLCSSSPMLGWIPWVLSLTYPTLLEGVPGTGTRKGGSSGSMLNCQLDAVVMLRFHALGLKISSLATVLCIVILLPLFWTSECYDSQQQEQQENSNITMTMPGCDQSGTHNLTNYGRTTIANVPSLSDTPTMKTVVHPQQQNSTLIKLYIVCLVFCFMTMYFIHLIQQEWIHILAMRRVYYLECDVWGERQRELRQTTTSLCQSHEQQQQQQQHEPKETFAARNQQQQQQPPQQSLQPSSSCGGLMNRRRRSPRTTEKETAAETLILSELERQQSAASRYSTTTEPQQQQQQQPSSTRNEEQQRINGTGTHNSITTLNQINENVEHPQQNEQEEGEVVVVYEEPHLIERDPWVPHPEQRDTVPNISLYSVLVGGLPSLPESHVMEDYNSNTPTTTTNNNNNAASSSPREHDKEPDYDEDDEGEKDNNPADVSPPMYCKKRASIDWQLDLTSAFFDHCVPNQPGFSSSVAAVTILPSSRHIAGAWRKWYAAAAQLRRLRFIRRQIAQRRQFDIQVDDDDDDNDDDEESPSNSINVTNRMGRGVNLRVPLGESDPSSTSTSVVNNSPHVSHKKPHLNSDDLFSPIYNSKNKRHRDGNLHYNGNSSDENDDDTAKSRQQQLSNSKSSRSFYHRQVLGSVYDQDLESQFIQGLHFGPEQTAVYSRELAQSAAPCCPNGCWSNLIEKMSIDDLLDLERDAAAQVHQANLELLKARRQATRTEYKEASTHGSRVGSPGVGGGTGSAACMSGGLVAATENPAISGEQQQQQETHAKRSIVGKNSTIVIDMPSDLSLEATIYNKAAAKIAAPASPRQQIDHLTTPTPSCNSTAMTFSKSGGPRHRKNRSFDMAKSFDMANVPSSLGLEADLISRAQNREHGRHARKSSWDSAAGSVHSNNSVPKTSSNSKSYKQLRQRHGGHHRKSQSLDTDLVLDLSQVDPSSLSPRSPRIKAAATPGSNIDSLAKTAFDPGMLGQLLADDIAEYNKSNNDAPSPLMQQRQSPLQLPAPSELLVSKRSKTKNETVSSNPDGLNSKNNNALSPPPRGRVDVQPREESPSNCNPSQSSPVQSPPISKSNTDKRTNSSGNWDLVESIVADVSKSQRSNTTVADGSWRFPTISKIFVHSKRKTKLARDIIKEKTKDLARESTYAVVTFTSRQAAVAARHCLADGRAGVRWMSLQELPISPLADAASWDLCVFRNCCRPVTISIDERQKMWRNYIALLLLAVIYIFYTIPLTLASTLVAPENLEAIMPDFFRWADERWDGFAGVVSGIMQSLIWTAFFASCPVIFRSIANFGSNATSVANAEFKALQYFWWFMVTSAFSGTLLANMFLSVFRSESTLERSFRDLMISIGQQIPTTSAASWLNWLILRFTCLLPLNYLLNINAYLFQWLKMNCCSRMVRGGGPGGPAPYRIYVDSGVVLLILLSLAPASPLIAPACFIYFLLCQPLFRWNSIFVYRPKYDGGGLRWPLLSDMMFSALLLSQVLLTTQMVLKAAIGPAIGAAIPMLPTLIMYRGINKRFRRAFEDAALLQTSLLDGWDTRAPQRFEEREAFRRFLVDAHKAAYVPICIAGNDDEDAALTSEPAVVVPAESDIMKELLVEQQRDESSTTSCIDEIEQENDEDNVHTPRCSFYGEKAASRRLSQRGATMRRSAHTISAMHELTAAARQRRNTFGSRSSSILAEDVASSLQDISTESPFNGAGMAVLPSQTSLRHRFQSQQQQGEKLE